jgi:hydroxyversicolorone monooxygenase
VLHSKDIEHQLNELFLAFYKQTEAQAKFQNIFRKRMKKLIRDERLLKGERAWIAQTSNIFSFQTDFLIKLPACDARRSIYIEALQKSNVDVYFTCHASNRAWRYGGGWN